MVAEFKEAKEALWEALELLQKAEKLLDGTGISTEQICADTIAKIHEVKTAFNANF